MIKRDLESVLLDLAGQFPVVALLGPRQSGKTTLAQLTFPLYKYVSLEDFDALRLAQSDPRDFLAIHDNGHGIILDEIQNAPELLSYIKTEGQESGRSYCIYTGAESQNRTLVSVLKWQDIDQINEIFKE